MKLRCELSSNVVSLRKVGLLLFNDYRSGPRHFRLCCNFTLVTVTRLGLTEFPLAGAGERAEVGAAGGGHGRPPARTHFRNHRTGIYHVKVGLDEAEGDAGDGGDGV